MKVLVVSHDATRTGAPILLLNTLEEMKNVILDLDPPEERELEPVSKAGETYLLDWGYSFLPQGMRALPFWGLRQKRPDLVYATR